MADQYVQLAADSTGKKADVTELTVGTNTVERQRINVADPTQPTAIQAVDLAGNAAVQDAAAGDLQRQILIELRVISSILAHGFNLEVDSIRNNFSGD